MAAADLALAFNSVSQPQYACTKALLGYERHDGVESQVLTFSGRAATGEAFTIKSDRQRKNADLMLAARETAARLVEHGPPPP